MKIFSKYWKETTGEDLPKNKIPVSWFSLRRLPMIVACTCCGSTMCLVSAFIDDDEYCYCSDCGSSD